MISRHRSVWLTVAVLVAISAVAAMLGRGPARFRLVTDQVTRGSITRSVSTTGTVNPVITVQVGSHVSGPIIALRVDFNSPVRKGQIIAKIDPQPFEMQVAQARAALTNARAALRKDQADMRYKKLLYERNRELLREGAAAQDTVDNDLSSYQQSMAQIDLDKATVMQQEAALHEQQVNLGYTTIVSPVDGVVVSRNVDVGQTVAASFQTPTLFLIAQDLTQMQVDCNVSEADIGDVRAGQPATFRVDAFPDREWRGVVSQVRQAPITVQNVVTYDVVVAVSNPEVLLKPGMTANVVIVTARHDDALTVPLQAIRFVPRRLLNKHPAGTGGGTESTGDLPRHARVWIPHGHGLRPVEVVTGLSDGSRVEIQGNGLGAGQKVVIDQVRIASRGLRNPLPRLFH